MTEGSPPYDASASELGRTVSRECGVRIPSYRRFLVLDADGDAVVRCLPPNSTLPNLNHRT